MKKRLFNLTSYSKYDEKSKQTIGLPEDVALEESAELNRLQDEYFLSLDTGIDVKLVDAVNDESFEFKDSYMKLTHAVAIGNEDNNGTCIYTTTAEWLTMPMFRGTDSIGSCANNGSITHSANGHYSYNTTIIDQGVSSGPVNSGEKDMIRIDDASTDGWFGFAGYFDLPNDLLATDRNYIVRHTNLTAYLEFEGNVTNPELITNFNSNGSYYHTRIAIEFNPSIGFDYGAEVTIGIHLIDFILDIEIRVAPLKITYRP